jgi:hypothetical protein
MGDCSPAPSRCRGRCTTGLVRRRWTCSAPGILLQDAQPADWAPLVRRKHSRLLRVPPRPAPHDRERSVSAHARGLFHAQKRTGPHGFLAMRASLIKFRRYLLSRLWHYHRLWKLNYRVRDGNGCDLPDMFTGNILSPLSRRLITSPLSWRWVVVIGMRSEERALLNHSR